MLDVYGGVEALSVGMTGETVATARRVVRLVVATSVLAAGAAWAETPAHVDAHVGQPLVLDEATVVRLASQRMQAVLQAADELALARRQGAGRLPNPIVGWQRETVETGSQSAQDMWTASMRLEFSRRLALRELAEVDGTQLRANAAKLRTEMISHVVNTYYDAELARSHARVLADSLSDLDEAARVLAERERVGEASGYASMRLSIAVELGRSEHAEAMGAYRSALAKLAALLELESAAIETAGSVDVSALPAEAELLQGGVAQREPVRLAREAERHAARARARAGWAWIPAMSLQAGLNRATSEQAGAFTVGYGYIAGVSLQIPLSDHGQSLRAETQARGASARAHSDVLVRKIRAEIQTSYAAYESARAELDRFELGTAVHVEQLLRAVQTGYREGELGIVELLDAQRARTEVAQRRLTLLGAAKRAEVRVRAAAGELQR